MTDCFTKEQRSDVMRRVKSKDTDPEFRVRKYLHKLGFRYRLHQKKLPGSPDIVLSKYKTIININGCFWHGHNNCKRAVLPASNHEYWEKKIQKNMDRDKENKKRLAELGWNVVDIFECELVRDQVENTFIKLISNLLS